jgi:hypothetical protein
VRLLEKYFEELQAHYQQEADQLIHGSPSSLEAYRQRVGYLAGLRAAETILHDLLRTTPTKERD